MIQYYDVHCHVFNKDVIIRRLVNVIQTLLEITDTDDLATIANKMERLLETFDVVANESSEEVFKVLNDSYNKEFIITPLMLDLTYADDNDGNERRDRRYRRRIEIIFRTIKILLGIVKRKMKSNEGKALIDKLRDDIENFYKNFKVRTDKEVEIFDDANYEKQILDLEHLVKNYPNVKPFFSVDPRQEYKDGLNTIDNLKQKLLGPDAKFKGVKLYAPVGFSPTDAVLMGTKNQQGVYDFCEKNNIPVTVHCSNSGFACLSTNLKVNGHLYLYKKAVRFTREEFTFHYKFLGKNVGEAISERASILNNPGLWAMVLKKYPNLTINFAHFGGSTQLMDYVYYRINRKQIDVDDFEESISQLPANKQDIIRSGYTRKRRKMILNEFMTITQKAQVWNTMYYAKLIDNWAKDIFELVRNPNYPNACVDLSCFSTGEMVDLPGDSSDKQVFSIKESLRNFKASFYNKLTDYEKSKILYGSDYFLLQFFGPSMKQYLSDFKAAFGDDFDVIASENPKRFLFET